MNGSTMGERFRITTWGESHGKALGVVIDGCPAGLKLCADDIQAELDRRKPGQSVYTTPRKESDEVLILSGVYEGITTGTPISLMIENKSQHSSDYDALKDIYRPGHADFTYDKKYGFRDHRGGGRSSARETAARVAAGAVAKRLISTVGIDIKAYVRQIGEYVCQPERMDMDEVEKNPLRMPDPIISKSAGEYLKTMIKDKDSVGGVIECIATGVPAGLGEPVFDKLDAALGGAMFSIGAVKGVEIGAGFSVASSRGSENNDIFYISPDGQIKKRTNNAGGILGGISDGDDIVLRVAIKPTPSIARGQQTVTKDVKETKIEIGGRHDPVIMPRAVPVIEAMTALVLADKLLVGMGSKLEDFVEYYR